MSKSEKDEKKEFKYYLVKGTDWKELKDIPNPQDDLQDQEWIENEEIELLRSQGGIFVNDTFEEHWENKSKLKFFAGGYGSSKTTYVVTRLLVKAMTYKYFRCFYGRQKMTEARQLHSNIITEIKRNHWEDYFKYSEAPTGSPEILCTLTGNKFVLFGCDDVASLKGWDNPTHIFVDEINQISFDAFGMLFSRLRGSGREVEMIGNFNNCDVYSDHWLVKYIYSNELSGKETTKQKKVIETLRKIKVLKHHSTYLDNHFQNPDAYLLTLELQAGGDPVRIKQFSEGGWGVSLKAQPFYKMFKKDEHVGDCIVNGTNGYNSEVPLHISWDENANPFLPVIICQIIGNHLFVIDEIAAKNPFNSLDWVCGEICERYKGHKAGMFVYGDATSEKQDVKLEKGKNFFTLILAYLEDFTPNLRKQDANPNVATRKNFINMIFLKKYGDIEITISSDCPNLIEDLQNCEESPDGLSKDKTKSMVDGKRGVQKWGHLTDCLDYILCEAFHYQYALFQTLGKSHKASGGKRIVNNAMEKSVAQIKTEEKDDRSRFRYGGRQSRNAMN